MWPNFDATAPREVVISILLMINEKYLEGQDALACIERTHPERFAALVDQALTIALEDATAATDKATIREQTTAVIFLIRCFQSLVGRRNWCWPACQQVPLSLSVCRSIPYLIGIDLNSSHA